MGRHGQFQADCRIKLKHLLQKWMSLFFVAIINAERQFAVIYLARFKNVVKKVPKMKNLGIDKGVHLIDIVVNT